MGISPVLNWERQLYLQEAKDMDRKSQEKSWSQAGVRERKQTIGED